MTKVALITGAGSGIGKACALALARDGWSLMLCGRRLERLKPVADEASALGVTAVVSKADVGVPSEVKLLFNELRLTFDRLDLLFNNAGTGAPPLPFDELSFEQWQRVVDTNLTGAFLCAQGAFAMMKSQTLRGGRIINNGSISAHVPRPNSAPYTATKHAITGLTRSIALDGRPFDIACGQIDIGNAQTDLTARMTMGQGVPQANGQMAPEPVMDVAHCGSAIRYMASLPLDANVLSLVIKATNMPFEGRG